MPRGGCHIMPYQFQYLTRAERIAKLAEHLTAANHAGPISDEEEAALFQAAVRIVMQKGKEYKW